MIKSVLGEMASLRQEFASQSEEMRKLMKLVTATPQEPETQTRYHQTATTAASEPDIHSLEGIWTDKLSQSVFYVRVVNGQLLVPYSFSGSNKLDAHLFNYKISEGTLFARFKWFDSKVSGYIFLKLAASDTIKGGWWFEADLPKEILADISRVSGSLPGMNELLLVRKSHATDFPPEVEEYFSEA